MKKTLFVWILLVFVLLANAQQNVYNQSFEWLDASYKTSKGVVGKALDLTIASPTRQPLMLANKLAGYKGNFTVGIWAKAAVNIRQQYTFLESSHHTKDTSFGWQLGNSNNGAWYCKLWYKKDGKNVAYDYTPTAQQTIADGQWHHLAFSYDTAKQEAAFYFDGRNVAILHTPGLRQLMADTLQVGGPMEGLANEWESLNGCVDELKLYNAALPASQLATAKDNNQALNKTAVAAKSFKVMNYNILHGGHETGKEVGVQRVVEVIKASGADIISMQETYGSGPEIADALGYYFYLRGSNLAVYSRYPIETSLQAGVPFNSGGVVIKMPNGKRLAFFTNWLTYPFDYWEVLEKKEKIDSADWYAQQDKVNAGNLRQNLSAIAPSLAKADKEGMPVIFCGDLNTGSHLDWTEATRHLNAGYVMPFPTTKIMQQQGFKDSYRIIHPNPLKDRGITWSPMFATAFKDRIDYIYYKSDKIKPVASTTIATHPVRYPSDHAALLTTFEWVQ